MEKISQWMKKPWVRVLVAIAILLILSAWTNWRDKQQSGGEASPTPTQQEQQDESLSPTPATDDETPTPQPTDEPSKDPTDEPTKAPTKEPTKEPTKAPTKKPTNTPTEKPDVWYEFRSKSQLDSHFEKHGHEMNASSAQEYLKMANQVIQSEDALYKREKEDNDHIYYLVSTNEFVVVSQDGYIRTYFLPSAGLDYFNRQ